MNKINLFERDPKSALLIEIEFIVDDDKRYNFEELREKVLSGRIKKESEILDEAETLMVNSEKKECLTNLRFILDDNNSLEDKL